MSWTDPDVGNDNIKVRKLHMDELRANAVAKGCIVPFPSWTDSNIVAADISITNPTSIKPIHFNELYTSINNRYIALGLPAPTWTAGHWPMHDDVTVGGIFRPRKRHILDLRQNIDAIVGLAKVYDSGSINVRDVWMLSGTNNGYACGFANDSPHTEILLATTDGGTTWNPKTIAPFPSYTYLGNGHRINAIHPFSSSEIYVASWSTYAYLNVASETLDEYTKSIDGNIFPVKSTSPIGFGYAIGITDIWPLSSNVVISCSDVSLGSRVSNPVFTRSTDGYNSFTEIFTNPNYSFKKMWFTSSTVGYAVGTQHISGTFQNDICGVKTIDGGITWNTMPSLISNPVQKNDSLNSIHFVSSDTGYAIASKGRLFKTTNAGLTWSMIHDFNWTLNSDADIKDLRSVYFISENVGFVCAGTNRITASGIWNTTDGGNTWANITTSLMVNEISVDSSGHIFFAANGGVYRIY